MKLNLLAFAIPFFLMFMALEYWWGKRKRKKVYQVSETIANINVGIAERLSDILTTGAFYFFFTWIHENFAIFQIKASILNWALLFLLTDLVWYWYHRFGHEVNLFWSVHVVHHQSDDFNYSVSARITVLQAIARGLFWSVLPLVGFSPHMVTILLMIHGTYPFFTHTQLVGKLGWIEYILVTPSHHRVHHSSNEEYLDKNYGDVLIIWDKIFGTFAKEEAVPKYGLTEPLKGYSFLWQHFHFILEMIIAFKRAKGFTQKCKILFGKPDNIDPRIRTYLEKKLASKNKQYAASDALLDIIKIQTVFTLVILFFTILFSDQLTMTLLCILSLFIVLSVIATGAMLEQRRWIFHLDYARLVLISLFSYIIYPHQYVAIIIVIILAFILGFYKSLNNQYHNIIYRLR